MSSTDPDIEVLETELVSPPSGTPRHFRELVALTLKTTDSTVLDAAERDYRGVFVSVHDYIDNQLGEHLPPHLQWLPACCEPEKLRLGYERGTVRLWTIRLPDGRVLVFESQREPGRHRPGG
jgi:hypothetical protein